MLRNDHQFPTMVQDAMPAFLMKETINDQTRVEPVGCGPRQHLPQSGHGVIPTC